MSDFFGNVGKAFKDAAKKTMKVSGDAVEVTKTSMNIKFDESKRENFLKEIGAAVYENYKKDASSACPEIIDLCKCLDEIERAITEQKAKLANISNKKYCVGCGIKLDKTDVFCHSCGTKQPEIVIEPEPEEETCCCCGDDDSCCDIDNDSDEDCECCNDSCCDNDECTEAEEAEETAECACNSEQGCECSDKE